MTRTDLLPETQQILAALENRSGYPVEILTDPTLAQAAALTLATAANPVNAIRCRADSGADYPIALEAAQALRVLRHPRERRFRLIPDDGRRETLGKEIGKLHRKLPPQVFRALAGQVLEGMIQQLGQCPTGILADRWLHADYPALRPAQSDALREQLDANAACLTPEFAEQFPQAVVYANRAMNAAYAVAVGELLQEPALAEPYRSAGLGDIAAALLAELPAQDTGVPDDRALIAAWADLLRVLDWLQWLPAEEGARETVH